MTVEGPRVNQGINDTPIKLVDTFYCTNCGQPLKRHRVCPHCNAKSSKNYKAYCKYCGSPIENRACISCGKRVSFNIISFLARAFVWFWYVYSMFLALYAFEESQRRYGNDLFKMRPAFIIAGVSTLLMLLLFRKRQIDKITQKLLRFKILRVVAVYLVYVLLVAVFIVWSTGYCVDCYASYESYRDYAVEATKNDMDILLKNPESLQIHNTFVSSKHSGDYYCFRVVIDYSAQNGFGGYNRDVYKGYWVIGDFMSFVEPVYINRITEKEYESIQEDYSEISPTYGATGI